MLTRPAHPPAEYLRLLLDVLLLHVLHRIFLKPQMAQHQQNTTQHALQQELYHNTTQHAQQGWESQRHGAAHPRAYSDTRTHTVHPGIPSSETAVASSLPKKPLHESTSPGDRVACDGTSSQRYSTSSLLRLLVLRECASWLPPNFAACRLW